MAKRKAIPPKGGLADTNLLILIYNTKIKKSRGKGLFFLVEEDEVAKLIALGFEVFLVD